VTNPLHAACREEEEEASHSTSFYRVAAAEGKKKNKEERSRGREKSRRAVSFLALSTGGGKAGGFSFVLHGCGRGTEKCPRRRFTCFAVPALGEKPSPFIGIAGRGQTRAGGEERRRKGGTKTMPISNTPSSYPAFRVLGGGGGGDKGSSGLAAPGKKTDVLTREAKRYKSSYKKKKKGGTAFIFPA